MNVNDIIELARDQSYCNISQVPNDIALKYLNIVKNDFFSYLLTYADDNYNWSYFKTNTVINQDEYNFPQVAFDSAWILKIKELYINYDWKTYDNWLLMYNRAREVNPTSLNFDWNYYLNEQNPDSPIFYIADNSVFIAPAPTVAITNWIQVKWIKNIPDYTIDTTEAQMKLPIPYHYILVQWLLPYFYKKRWDMQKSSYENWEYIRQRQEICKQLGNRNIWTHIMSYWETENNWLTL